MDNIKIDNYNDILSYIDYNSILSLKSVKKYDSYISNIFEKKINDIIKTKILSNFDMIKKHID